MNPKSKSLLKKIGGNSHPSLLSKTVPSLLSKTAGGNTHPFLQSETVDSNTPPLFNSQKVKDQVSVIIPGFYISTIPYEKFTALTNRTLRATLF